MLFNESWLTNLLDTMKLTILKLLILCVEYKFAMAVAVCAVMHARGLRGATSIASAGSISILDRTRLLNVISPGE